MRHRRHRAVRARSTRTSRAPRGRPNPRTRPHRSASPETSVAVLLGSCSSASIPARALGSALPSSEVVRSQHGHQALNADGTNRPRRMVVRASGSPWPERPRAESSPRTAPIIAGSIAKFLSLYGHRPRCALRTELINGNLGNHLCRRGIDDLRLRESGGEPGSGEGVPPALGELHFGRTAERLRPSRVSRPWRRSQRRSVAYCSTAPAASGHWPRSPRLRRPAWASIVRTRSPEIKQGFRGSTTPGPVSSGRFLGERHLHRTVD